MVSLRHTRPVVRLGFEYTAMLAAFLRLFATGDAECNAVIADHPELARWLESSASLPEPTQHAILALTEITGGEQ